MSHTRNMNSTQSKKLNGFGIQRDITEDGAILYLRITDPRRLNVKVLGEVLIRYLQGGYKTLVLDQGKYSRKRLSLLEFLGRLQATYTESRLFSLERRLKRDRVTI